MLNWKCRHAFHDLRATPRLASQLAGRRWQSKIAHGSDAKRLHCNSFINPHCLIAPPTNGINCRGWQLCPALVDANTDRHAGSFWPGYFCMAISCNDVNKIHSAEIRRWWTAICFRSIGEEASCSEPGCGAKTQKARLPPSKQWPFIKERQRRRKGSLIFPLRWQNNLFFFAVWFALFLMDCFGGNFYLLLGWG